MKILRQYTARVKNEIYISRILNKELPGPGKRKIYIKKRSMSKFTKMFLSFCKEKDKKKINTFLS